jgi:hypothetical protein
MPETGAVSPRAFRPAHRWRADAAAAAVAAWAWGISLILPLPEVTLSAQAERIGGS